MYIVLAGDGSADLIYKIYEILQQTLMAAAEELGELREALLNLEDIAVEPEAKPEAEESKDAHRTTLIFSYKRPPARRLDIIPWYTSGFE